MPGTLKQPFATLERARDEVRRLKAAGPLQGGATVHVRAGFYCRQQPFDLGAEDAGTEDAPADKR